MRIKFQVMFVRANPGVHDVLEACNAAFAQLDADGSGYLSHKEFMDLLRGITGEACSAKMLKRLLRLVDVDQSGRVDLEEFLRFAAPTFNNDLDTLDYVNMDSRIKTMVKNRDTSTSGAANGESHDAVTEAGTASSVGNGHSSSLEA